MSETLQTIVAEATGLSPSAISISPRPPLDNQSNQLYDVWASNRHLIVKEFLKPDELQDAPVREFRALTLLAPLDIAPQPVLFQPFSEIEARFRTLFQTYAAWVEAEFAPGRQAVDLCFTLLESRRIVIRELSDYTPPLCFCRADPRFANVIQRPDGRLGLVDWEDSGLRDPARDLADIITHPNQEDIVSLDRWQAFLQPYIAVRCELDPHLLRRMHLYLALFPVFWLAVLVREGMRLVGTDRLVGWNVHGLPGNEKLRRYLARGLAWPEMDFSNHKKTLADVEFFPNV